jgi:hypothetical protein
MSSSGSGEYATASDGNAIRPEVSRMSYRVGGGELEASAHVAERMRVLRVQTCRDDEPGDASAEIARDREDGNRLVRSERRGQIWIVLDPRIRLSFVRQILVGYVIVRTGAFEPHRIGDERGGDRERRAACLREPSGVDAQRLTVVGRRDTRTCARRRDCTRAGQNQTTAERGLCNDAYRDDDRYDDHDTQTHEHM